MVLIRLRYNFILSREQHCQGTNLSVQVCILSGQLCHGTNLYFLQQPVCLRFQFVLYKNTFVQATTWSYGTNLYWLQPSTIMTGSNPSFRATLSKLQFGLLNVTNLYLATTSAICLRLQPVLCCSSTLEY